MQVFRQTDALRVNVVSGQDFLHNEVMKKKIKTERYVSKNGQSSTLRFTPC